MITPSARILAEVNDLVGCIQQSDFDRFYDSVFSAQRVMAYATGRSGFFVRTFIMRLNHLGLTAYYVGEASTLPVQSGDLFLTVSGSGSTATSLGAAQEAQRLGAEVIAILGTKDSALGQLAQTSLILPHRTNAASPTTANAVNKPPAVSLSRRLLFYLRVWFFITSRKRATELPQPLSVTPISKPEPLKWRSPVDSAPANSTHRGKWHQVVLCFPAEKFLSLEWIRKTYRNITGAAGLDFVGNGLARGLFNGGHHLQNRRAFAGAKVNGFPPADLVHGRQRREVTSG